MQNTGAFNAGVSAAIFILMVASIYTLLTISEVRTTMHQIGAADLSGPSIREKRSFNDSVRERTMHSEQHILHHRERFESVLEKLMNQTHQKSVVVHMHHKDYMPESSSRERNGYLQWSSTVEHESDNSSWYSGLSTPIIRYSGLYMVYAQVTFRGRQEPSLAGDSLAAAFSVIVHEAHHQHHKILISCFSTQMNSGGPVSYNTLSAAEDHATDSCYSAAIKPLTAGQILAVNCHTTGTFVDVHKSRTFFGYYLISEQSEYSHQFL